MLAYSSADPSKLDGLRNPVKAGNVVSSSRLLREMLRRRERGEKNRPRQALSLSLSLSFALFLIIILLLKNLKERKRTDI